MSDSPIAEMDVMLEPLTEHAPITEHKNFSNHEASYRDFVAFLVVEQAIQSALDWAKRGKDTNTPGPVLPPQSLEPLTLTPRPIGKIGIIGAGVAGLYAAMILKSLDIDYEILEANNRIGGRVFTHRFNGDEGIDAPVGTPARYDYFDVGAMRFPKIPFMRRVWDLFHHLELQDLLIDYKFSAQNNLMYFNTVPPLKLNPNLAQSTDESDYFQVSVSNGGAVPDDFVKGPESVNNLVEEVYDYWRNLFAPMDDKHLTKEERRKIFHKAWSTLRQEDNQTTRSVMSAGQRHIDVDWRKGHVHQESVRPFPNEVIDWLETFASGTGMFNTSFIESVLGSLDFNWPFATTGNIWGRRIQTWKTIDGGSDHLPREMAKTLRVQPKLNKRVIKMEERKFDILVTIDGEQKPRLYDQVISTVTLGCLAGIDVEQCGLSYSQKLAVRSLEMMASTKIGIKFATRWWQREDIMGIDAAIEGGQSTTDTPIRCCVYPSYGLDCEGAPGVLIVSYSWSQDALRLGALASGTEEDREELLRLTLDNLSKLHDIPKDQFGDVVDFFAHSFYADPYARGAFAHFGPGQFGKSDDRYSMFASLKAPAAHGKLHIAGEATSAHHGWVLGALNSAWRAVYHVLRGNEVKREQLIARWGIPDEENQVQLDHLHVLAMEGWV